MKLLVIRLSSLGDLILSTAGLAGLAESDQVHWVTSSEYLNLIQDHPRIHTVVGFDRKRSGLFAWMKLGFELRRKGFDQVVDLHSSLRTTLLRVIFMGVPWRSIRKRRWRRFGLFLFKEYWPRRFLPTPWVREFSQVLSGSPAWKPDLGFLIEGSDLRGVLDSQAPLKNYFCVMPDSAWEGKCWPLDRFLELLSTLPEAEPVILGTRNDLRSRDLIDALKQRGVKFQDARGLSWRELASILVRCRFLLSNDTGLVHFAESLGVPAISLFGPTTPELGFSPHLPLSRVIQADLSCRPCSSDGSGCYWRGEARYKCLKRIEVSEVRGECRELIRQNGADAGVGQS